MKQHTVQFMVFLAAAIVIGFGASTVLKGQTFSPQRAADVLDFRAQLAFLPIDYLAASEQFDRPAQAKISAILIPHDLPAGKGIISAAYAAWYQREPEVRQIALLTLDHFHLQSGIYSTGAEGYESGNGTLASAPDILTALRSCSEVSINDTLISQEHGFFHHIPYVSFYFPEAQVLPIIVGQRLSKESAKETGRCFARSAPEDMSILLSADLSHYKSLSSGEHIDQITAEALSTLSLGELSRESIDAYVAMYFLSGYLEEKQIMSGQVLKVSSSARFGGDTNNANGYAVIVY